MTEEENNLVKSFNENHQKLLTAGIDSIGDFAVNRNKNLIIIVVESLNAWAVNYEYNGSRLMPVLSEIIKSDGTISSLEVITQVRSGNSSDGQFIYNTGLYPASDVTTVQEYLENDLPSIAKILSPRPSFEIICETPNMWNHVKSNKAYGYDNFIYNTDRRAKKEGIGRDGAMFKTALEVIDTIQKPFFGFLVTMSMHGPFNDKNVKMPEWIANIPDISESMRKYLNVTNYFDSALGEFIEGLKIRGLFDNSIIAIASDHSIFVEGSGYDRSYNKIVFAVTGSGHTIRSTTPIGQVDVFPTILQIMDRLDPTSYTGMGLSMLNPALKGAIDKNSKIHGDSISDELESMLQKSAQTANIILRGNKCYLKDLDKK